MGGCVVGLREGDVLAAGGLGGGVGEGVSGGVGGDGVGVGSQEFQSALEPTHPPTGENLEKNRTPRTKIQKTAGH